MFRACRRQVAGLTGETAHRAIPALVQLRLSRYEISMHQLQAAYTDGGVGLAAALSMRGEV